MVAKDVFSGATQILKRCLDLQKRQNLVVFVDETMADYKAVSMNLMHTDIRVTDGIYAPLASDDVQRRITGLTNLPIAMTPGDDITKLMGNLSNEQQSQLL